jgi:PAS domain S-box-containing protein
MHDRSGKNQELLEEISVLKKKIETSEAEYKRTNHALREREELYTKLISTMPDIIVHVDLKGEILFINDVGLSLGGFQRQELIGRNMLSFIAPEDQDRAARNTALMFEKRLGPQEYHLITKDGRKLLFQINGDVLRNEDGSPHGVVHICRDITERRREEDEAAVIAKIGRLINSSLNIEDVYEQFCIETRKLIPFDRLVLNLITQPQAESIRISYVFGSDIPGRMAGDSLPFKGSLIEEIMKTRTSIFLQPEDEEEIIRRFPILRPIVEAGSRSLMVIPLISRDEVMGALHFQSKAKMAYTPEDLGLAEKTVAQIAGAIANAQLYSNLQKTEGALRQSENKFRALVEHAAVGITEVEAGTGRYIAVNPMLCKMLGMTEQEMLATTFMAITHPEDLNLHPNLSKRMYGGEFDHYSLEKRYIRKDGRVIWVNLTISRLWKPGETPGRSISIVHDITDRKQVEETLKETLDQLESRVRERTIELEETNTALRVLIKKADKDQKILEESLQSNVNQLVTPFLSRLRVSQSNPERLTYLNILETNLNNIVSPFINRLSAAYRNLTPKEIQIAELVKQGKRSKEIAELFGLSVGTVITHRNNIRKKLDLKSKDANLRSHLLSLA